MARTRLLFLLLPLSLILSPSPRTQQKAPPYQPQIPLGLDEVPIPPENPLTLEKVELGRLLYFDPRLSRDETVSCATCHSPQKGYTDNLPVSVGIKGQKGGRSAPTVINAAYNPLQFWDGRAPSLEEQAKGPIANPIEMGFTHAEAVTRLKTIKGYQERFKAAFGTEDLTVEHVVRAIASFERTVLSGNSPFDRYEDGDTTALTPQQVLGMELFKGKANCTACHVGITLSDGKFHNIGVGMKNPEPDLGRYHVTKEEKDKGAFKTPTVRNITLTAPYMHDGSMKTLEEVVEFYDQGGEPNPWLDKNIKPLNLTQEEKPALLTFLRALTGDFPKLTPPKLP